MTWQPVPLKQASRQNRARHSLSRSHGWMLSFLALLSAVAASEPYIAPSSQPGWEETDPWFLWAEEVWIKPCSARLPRLLHGLCMYGPAFVLAMALFGTVALLAYFEDRSKKRAEAEKAKKAD